MMNSGNNILIARVGLFISGISMGVASANLISYIQNKIKNENEDKTIHLILFYCNYYKISINTFNITGQNNEVPFKIQNFLDKSIWWLGNKSIPKKMADWLFPIPPFLTKKAAFYIDKNTFGRVIKATYSNLFGVIFQQNSEDEYPEMTLPQDLTPFFEKSWVLTRMFHSIRCFEQDWFCYELLYRLLFFINAKMKTTGEDHQFWKSRDVMTAPWKAIAFQEDCWRPYTIAWMK